MKKYSIQARELLSDVELYDIKAGDKPIPETGEESSCGVLCATCVGCTTCTSCSSVMMDVFIKI